MSARFERAADRGCSCLQRARCLDIQFGCSDLPFQRSSISRFFHRPVVRPLSQGRDYNFYGTNDEESNSNMKLFALGVLLGLALTVQAFAIIRPPYPARPMPPHHGHFIVIGDDAKPGQAVVKPPK